MFRDHRPIFRRVRTAVHTTIGSVSVLLCSRTLCVVKHVEIQKYTNKIVTSVGFHAICLKDARYKKLKIKMIFYKTDSDDDWIHVAQVGYSDLYLTNL